MTSTRPAGTFNPRTELYEHCASCTDGMVMVINDGRLALCLCCNGTTRVRRGIFDAASGIDGPPEPRHVTARMVALARLMRDDANSEPLRELLDLVDGGAA